MVQNPHLFQEPIKMGPEKQFLYPAAVKEYNENMGGVAKADMLRAVHSLDSKSKKVVA